jgi:hypothetical protein
VFTFISLDLKLNAAIYVVALVLVKMLEQLK